MEDQHAPAASPEEIIEADVQRRLDELLNTIGVFGISELASRWGVSKQRADEIASTRLGAPWRVLAMGRIWNKKQVSAFEKTWVRKSGKHINPHPWK
jgi:hypothetical protein